MVKVYALSTCPWCKKLKHFLDQEGIEYCVVDVDLVPEAKQREALKEMRCLSNDTRFPLTAVGDEIVVGYDPKRVKELLEAENNES